MSEASEYLSKALSGLSPKVALVLGSGLGDLVSEVGDPVRVSYGDLPGFPQSGVTGHAGEIVAGKLGGVDVVMLSGRAHY